MRFANRAICVGGLLIAVTGLAACGSGGTLLSSTQASELKNQLALVRQSLDTGQCAQARTEINNFRSTVDGLGSVSQTLVNNLDQGATTIKQLAARQCPVHVFHPKTNTTPTQTQTTTTPTTPTQTSTTPTTPTQTTTTPTQTITTPTTTGPGSGGVGIGNGDGNGNGKGHGNGGGD